MTARWGGRVAANGGGRRLGGRDEAHREGGRGRVESRHGGGGRPTEGGEDRDTKGFDVQPFHRLYFSGSLLSLRLVSSLPDRASTYTPSTGCSESAAKAAID